ncbi:hypothetical protein [Phaffia rhodozyma]|uniref:Uncharacterized protein n=1 Tax=Phaffia rhodozyma TaxID=264483 RepID=A0A0F7SI95_PHARH|nr:hypothetical protein [Phaffia rhodozyma]
MIHVLHDFSFSIQSDIPCILEPDDDGTDHNVTLESDRKIDRSLEWVSPLSFSSRSLVLVERETPGSCLSTTLSSGETRGRRGERPYDRANRMEES